MKQKLILFVSFLFWGIGVAFSQIKVTGIVVDEQDEPVIGATIQIKGDKSKGTITDIDGKFKISAPQNAQLVVSFVGMQSEEVKVAPTMKITLHASSEMLEEVVVTGMVATDKRLFTGAADKLSASDVKIDGMADPEYFGHLWYSTQNPCAWSYFHLWEFQTVMGGRWCHSG